MKSQPQRMCSVCRMVFDKRELLRLVKTETGLVVDIGGKMSGRGAYICQSPACIDKCKRTKIFKKLFGVDPSEELIASIEKGLFQKTIDQVINPLYKRSEEK